MGQKQIAGYLISWLLLIFLLTSLTRGCNFLGPPVESSQLLYSDFVHEVERGNIKNALFTSKGMVTGELAQPVNGKNLFSTEMSPSPSMDFVESMRKTIIDKNPGAKVEFKIIRSSNFDLLISFFPLIFIGVFMFLLFKRQNQQGNNAILFGKSKAKLILNTKNVTFADVSGQD